jgi:hypothetical protein
VVWFVLLLGLLLIIIILDRPRKLIFSFLILAGLLSLWDQTRWQPWFYRYFLMLAAMAVYAWKSPEAQNEQAALNVCRAIIAFTYFWSGLQKLNANFARETWPDIAGPFLRLTGGRMANSMCPFILSRGFIEPWQGKYVYMMRAPR